MRYHDTCTLNYSHLDPPSTYANSDSSAVLVTTFLVVAQYNQRM